MNYSEKAWQAVDEFLGSLGELAAEALKDGDYGAAAEVARMLERFSSVQSSQEPAPQPCFVPSRLRSRPKSDAKRPNSSKKSPPPKSPRSKKDYPFFTRDKDKLVKVGWSKKSREEYEHRTPHDAVLSFVKRLVEKVSPEEVFTAEELMPVLNTDSDEVPAYQVYLALKWFQHVGVIEKRGRDGYVLRGVLTENSVGDYWASLPVRKA